MTEFILTGADVLGRGVRDLGVRDGVLVDPAAIPGAPRIDCSGLVALPALVDPHTHLRDPGPGDAETIASGSLAAARGGFGAVFAMANTDPVADTVEIVEYELDRGLQAGMCDVHPVGAVTVGLGGETLSDIAGMAASRAGVRLFSDDGKCVARSDVMADALVAISAVGGILAQHAQDPLLTKTSQMDDCDVAIELGLPGWPGMAESSIVARDAIMAAYLGARVHVCHVSTAATVEVVRWAKSQGHPITAEVTPHHLTLDHATARTRDAVFKVNPPLRSLADVEALREALVDGTIDFIGTDHAPHTPASKHRDWCDAPMGMLGLETALASVGDLLVRSGRLTWAELADRMSTRAATLLGIADDHGGDLGVGRPASLCLVDPDRPWTVEPERLASLARNTPFADREYHTRVVATLLRGRVTHDLDSRF